MLKIGPLKALFFNVVNKKTETSKLKDWSRRLEARSWKFKG